jgi:hypothetical protein
VTLLAAAVVLLLCGASALGVNALARRHSGSTVPPAHGTAPSPTPRPTTKPTTTTSAAASCPLPQSWRTAIQAGVVPVDQPLNQPVSAGPDGIFLMMQQAISDNDFSHDELAIFDAQNHGTTIWQAADPVHDFVTVSPDSAISAGWVVYGVTRSQNLADHAVRAWNRQDGSTTDVRTLSTAEEAANLVIEFSPIVAGNTAYWIEHRFNDPVHQTLVAQQLSSGTRSTKPVSRVSQLIAVGNGLVMLHDDGLSLGSTTGAVERLSSGPGITVPASVAQPGRMFASDGSTLRWLTGSGDTVRLNSWTPGQATVHQVAAPNADADGQPIAPFVINVGRPTVIDTRNGQQFTLPTGWAMVLGTGADLMIAERITKFGAADIRRVNVNSLNPASC